MRSASIARMAIAWILLTGPSVPSAHGADAELPHGVRLQINGEYLPDDRFYAFIGAEHRDAKDAATVLSSMIRERVIDLEGRRRGLQVSDAEVELRYDEIERQTVRESQGRKNLLSVLAETGVSEREFKLVLARTILLEKVVREEFRGRSTEISDAKVTLWLQDRLQRAVIETVDLNPDLVARIDGEPVSVADFGQRYLAQFALGSKGLQDAETEFLRAEVARQEASRHGIEIDRAAIDAAMRERERALRSKPGFAEMTLDEFLKETGSSAAALRARPSFLTQLRLERLVDEVYYPGTDLYLYYRSRQDEFDRLYGPTVDLAVIRLKAGEEGAVQAGFAPRRVEDAMAELRALRRRIETGRARFEVIARNRSDHPSAKAGGAVGWVGAAHDELGALAAIALDADALTTAADEVRYLGPLARPDGVYLIEIRGTRERPTYPQIRREVRRHASIRLLDALARRARVVRRLP